jgi:shikimate kinase
VPARNIDRLSAAARHLGPVALIGPMAVGKSAIGHQLAQHLGCAFVDTDALVVAQHGTIAEIFASRGEHAFRELEARAVAQAIEEAQGNTTVISLGGGAVLDSGTLLAGDAMGRWRTLFATRQPVYERLADLVLDVRSGSVPELAHRLEDALGEHAAAKTAAVPTPAATKEVE